MSDQNTAVRATQIVEGTFSASEWIFHKSVDALILWAKRTRSKAYLCARVLRAVVVLNSELLSRRCAASTSWCWLS